MTPQLDTAIVEESSVKALTWEVIHGKYRAKYLPLQKGIYGDTEFYSAQTIYLSMKVLIFAKIEIDFFLNHF